jgi:DNA-binding transcriptional MerR regulator
MTKTNYLRSLGDMSDELRIPRHRIDYLLETRGIEPTARTANGRIRLFDDEAVERVRLAHLEVAANGMGRPVRAVRA